MGRPKKPADEKKRRSLTIKLTDEQFDLIEQEAFTRGLDKSKFLLLCLKGMINTKSEMDYKIEELEKNVDMLLTAYKKNQLF